MGNIYDSLPYPESRIISKVKGNSAEKERPIVSLSVALWLILCNNKHSTWLLLHWRLSDSLELLKTRPAASIFITSLGIWQLLMKCKTLFDPYIMTPEIFSPDSTVHYIVVMCTFILSHPTFNNAKYKKINKTTIIKQVKIIKFNTR